MESEVREETWESGKWDDGLLEALGLAGKPSHQAGAVVDFCQSFMERLSSLVDEYGS